MENITKALLITGGILIVIMVLTLLITAVNQISTYYSEQHDTTMVEQILDFNSKFENYAGQTIRGNELLSIINRVIDYNNYQSGVVGYEQVNLYVDLLGHEDEFMDSNVNVVVNQQITGNINNDNMKKISNLSIELTSSATGINGLTETILQKLASEIHNIAYDHKYTGDDLDEYKRYRLQRLTKIFGRTVRESEVNAIKVATCKYYELTQFKRAMFKCNGISHNAENSRVNGISFEAVIENDKIKLK